MGHYHRIINLTQRQRIVPMDVGVLDKIVEFGSSSGAAMAALWLLLGQEAWCGDRVAIMGYEGRKGDLAAEVVAETGLDHEAYYCGYPTYPGPSLDDVGEMARSVLSQRGIATFTARTTDDGYVLWNCAASDDVTEAGIDVVAANLDRREILDPQTFGDSRDLHLAAALGGSGGVTEALCAVLAASNKRGGRGGGDLRSSDPLVGSWAGDHIAVVPPAMCDGFVDISADARRVLADAGQGAYEVHGQQVTRLRPPWMARAVGLPKSG